MNEYRGKHAPSQPWPVASTAAVRSGKGRHRKKDKRKHIRLFFLILLLLVIISYPFLEARILLTEKTVLVMDDLPSDANHLRVVFLSDIPPFITRRKSVTVFPANTGTAVMPPRRSAQ